MKHTCTMSRAHYSYADYRALYLAHCAMYRRLFARTLDVQYIRDLRDTQRRLVALRFDV